MSGIQHATTRHSPPHVRKSSALKSTRPATAAKTSTLSPKITVGGSKKTKKEKAEVLDSEEDDDTMAMSFLQYCAMCEKQILVPNTSILYCSESCRRRDSIPAPTSTNPTSSVSFQKFGHSGSIMHNRHSASLPDPLPRFQPTIVNATKSARIPPHFHEGAADLDPTEWKPSETLADGDDDPPPKTGASTPMSDSGRVSLFGGSSTSLASAWKPKLEHRPSSEASNYLGQFHRSTDSLTSPKRRSTRAANNLTPRATPGLSHSPTVGSTGSEESLIGTPYELVMRPRASSRPTIAVSKSSTQAESIEVCYEKQVVPSVIDPNLRSASGSLKDLLAGAKKAGTIFSTGLAGQ